MSEKACEGGQTMESRHSGEHFAVCAECGSEVRYDMVDHPFWGFASSCPWTRQVGSATEATDAERAESTRRSEAP